MAYTSFGTRKALGRRYGVDPALLMESERLQAEYNLAPGREARGMQASQFAQGLELQREQMAGAERGGMVGTAGNLLTTGAMLRAMTMEKGAPFFVNPFAAKTAGVAGPGIAPVATGAGGAVMPKVGWGEHLVSKGWTEVPGGAGYGTTPAMMGYEAGAAAGPAAAGFEAGATAGAIEGTAPAAGAGMGAYALPAAVYVGSRIAGKALEGKEGFGDLSQTLRTPATGILRTGTEYLGNLTGIKEIGKVGREVSRIEEQLATGAESTIGQLFGAVTGAISSIFGLKW